MAENEMNPGISSVGAGMAPLCRFRASVLQSKRLVPVVLELEKPPVAVYRRQNPQADLAKYREELAAEHREVLEHLKALCLRVEVGQSVMILARENGTPSVTMTHQFMDVFNGLGVMMPGDVVPNVAKMSGVRTITLNEERVYLTLNQSVPFTGAPRVWERLDAKERAIRGEGVVVAVIDTGAV